MWKRSKKRDSHLQINRMHDPSSDRRRSDDFRANTTAENINVEAIKTKRPPDHKRQLNAFICTYDKATPQYRSNLMKSGISNEEATGQRHATT